MPSTFTGGDSHNDSDIQAQSTVLTAKRGRVKRRRSIENPSEEPAAETINMEQPLISYSSADDIELNVQQFCDNDISEVPEEVVTTDVQELETPQRHKFANKCVVVLEDRILPSNETIKNKNKQVVSTLRYTICDRPINNQTMQLQKLFR